MASGDSSAHDPFDDPVLGRVAWAAQQKEWVFAISLPSGQAVSGRIVPAAWERPLTEQGIAEIRERVRWIRDNEPSIRKQVTDRTFDGWLRDWYDEEIDTVTTKEEFRETISLAAIDVLEDRLPSLTYRDGKLFGGHAIVLSLGPSGEIRHDPALWG